MKSRESLMCTLIASALLFAGVAAAQEAPVPAPPPPAAPTAPMPPPTPAMMAPAPTTSAPTMTSASGNAATYQTPQGELTIRSISAPAPIVGPAPSFQQLSGGGKTITEDQAQAYPPLANDFINADHNRNHGISAAEYQQWLKQL